MIEENLILSPLVQKFIDNNCDNSSIDKNSFRFKTYLKKDDNDCFTIIDKENCIKCIFEKKYLEEYFSKLPSYNNINQFDGMLILIKKALFDIIFYKNVNKTISYRVVLIIKEFDLDQAQKMNENRYNKKYLNVNFVPEVENKLKNFYFNYIKKIVSLDENQKNINNHCKFNAANFIDKKFDGEIKSIINIFNDKSFYFLNSKNIDDFEDLEKNTSLKEIDIKIDNSISTEDNNNITIDKLENLDFKSLFFNQPSQNNKNKKDFSEYENVDINAKNNYYKMIGNKREREKYEKKEKNLPIEIQNLITRMKNEPPLTHEIFEKYKNYKKFSSNEYICEKI